MNLDIGSEAVDPDRSDSEDRQNPVQSSVFRVLPTSEFLIASGVQCYLSGPSDSEPPAAETLAVAPISGKATAAARGSEAVWFPRCAFPRENLSRGRRWQGGRCELPRKTPGRQGLGFFNQWTILT